MPKVPFGLGLCVLLSCLPSSTGDQSASCSLMAGDVAVVSFNSADPDSVTLVALRGIPEGTDIFITDIPWEGTELKTTSGEGIRMFRTNSAIAEGTVWYYPNGGAEFGSWSSIAGNFNLATTGDQILVYCGSTLAPVFLYGITHTSGWLISGATTSGTSYLPWSLNSTGASVSLPKNRNNQYYAGVKSGTAAALLKSISTPSNWSFSNPAPLNMTAFTVTSVSSSSPSPPSSQVPSSMHTAFPSSSQPSTAPSRPPTAAPSRTPSLAPTAVPATLTMSFMSTIVIDNVDSAAVTDADSKLVLIMTMQDAIPSISLNDIDVASMTPYTYQSAVLGAMQSYSVRYKIEIPLEDYGYTASVAASLYNSLTSSIDASVHSAGFQENLLTIADALMTFFFDFSSLDPSQTVIHSQYILTGSDAGEEDESSTLISPQNKGLVIAFLVIMVSAIGLSVYFFVQGQKYHDKKFGIARDVKLEYSTISSRYSDNL